MSELAYENCYGVINNHIIGKSTVDNRNLALVYDPDSVYNKGEHCIHGMKYWVCGDDNVTGTWNPAKWTQARVGDELKPLINRESVSVVANGAKSYTTLLNELFSLIDINKVKTDSQFEYSGQILPIILRSSTRYIFGGGSLSFGNTNFVFQSADIKETGSSIRILTVAATTNTAADYNSQIVASGIGFKIIY